MASIPYRPITPDPPGLYVHGPDSRDQGVPPGRLTELTLDSSAIYPGVRHRVRVYAPSADPTVERTVLVVLDGSMYLEPEGEMRTGTVLDNLVAAGSIPSTVGVFVDPGEPANRNAEYDPADDRHASFLVDEVMPRVRELVSISEDPWQWAILGGSSGGNAAFTAAWWRPDRFRRVVSLVGSFVQIPGGDPYPDLIASSPRKPMRVFLQAASRDLNWNRPEQNWFAENLRLAAALAEAGYDMRLVVGDGGHDANHGGVLLPDALRWLWR